MAREGPSEEVMFLLRFEDGGGAAMGDGSRGCRGPTISVTPARKENPVFPLQSSCVCSSLIWREWRELPELGEQAFNSSQPTKT